MICIMVWIFHAIKQVNNQFKYIISIKHFNDIFYNVDLFIINLNFITWFMHQNVLQVKIKISEKVGMMGI